MSTDLTIGQFFEYAGRITGPIAIIVFVVGLRRGWWFMASEVIEYKRQLARHEARDDKRTELVERTLDALTSRK